MVNLSRLLFHAGPSQIPAEYVDIYFQPLIDELKHLWRGVNAIDGSISPNLNQNFTLHGVLFCTEHDSQGEFSLNRQNLV